MPPLKCVAFSSHIILFLQVGLYFVVPSPVAKAEPPLVANVEGGKTCTSLERETRRSRLAGGSDWEEGNVTPPGQRALGEKSRYTREIRSSSRRRARSWRGCGWNANRNPAWLQALARVMGDNGRFVKWLIGLEGEVEDRVSKQTGAIASLPIEKRQYLALRDVIAERAKKQGWPEEILVLPLNVGDAWRPMLRQGKLFVDTAFVDAHQSGGAHTAGAHLLQLLYASEALNEMPELRSSEPFKNGQAMQTLMRFMGDGYLVNGQPFHTDTNLTWNAKSWKWKDSLWYNFFDAGYRSTSIDRAENIGSFYLALPAVQQIEQWAAEPKNFKVP